MVYLLFVCSFTPGKESPGKPSDELGLLGDTDIKNAVEDFDSSNWTLDQLEVSCQTLLQECYTSDDRRRRILSAGMLLKLIETYPSANRYDTELVATAIEYLASRSMLCSTWQFYHRGGTI